MSFLKSSMSFKNQIWLMSSLSATGVCGYCGWAIFYSGVAGISQLGFYFVVFVFWIILIFGSKFFIERVNVKVLEISKYIKENSINEKNNLNSIDASLKEFIKHTGEQLDALRENEKLMVTVSNLLRDTTQNADECKIISNKVTRDVNDGHSIMQKMVESVQTIEKTKDDLSEIALLIKKISNDTSAIHNIVSTTELLSLNASIEAARAGLAGKGFSVVAEEVGILAKNSGREANEIENIVVESQNKINNLVGQNQQRVEEGKVVSSEALNVFGAIRDAMAGISSRSENIRNATAEQKIGIDMANSGNEEIKNILKKNILDTVFLIKIYKTNEKNFKNIDDISNVINELIHAKSDSNGV
jgi:methyl-accepting chemotaxis protein